MKRRVQRADLGSISASRILVLGGLIVFSLFLAGCHVAMAQIPLPTLIPTAQKINKSSENLASWTPPATLTPTDSKTSRASRTPPATWTPLPATAGPSSKVWHTRPPAMPTNTPLPIPTNTPVTPRPTPTITPTQTPTPTMTPVIKPLSQYAIDEYIPLEAFPRPVGDNGWGVHWIPTVKQDPAVIDKFVDQVVRMHIKWVVFLNDNSNIGDNDYLVERLVDAGIMPVMRVYRSNLLPYDGDLGKMVAHYRGKGVYYFQLYNEPNVNEENNQGFANANQYALTWASAARDVIRHGGLPGIGAFSPGGAYNHYAFLDSTLRALKRNGDLGLLNHSWLSIHNYHGLRQMDDEGGFLLFRKYDEIIRAHLGHSMPMIGTEGGSYHPDPKVEKDFLVNQYSYMRNAEPYLFAFSHWLLANQAAGSWDNRWEYQALFRDGFVHPLVTEFFYHNRR